MALATYTDLQTSVGLWMNRSDLGTVIPDFVTLCEADLNRRLRCPQNEEMNTAFAVTGRYTTLPTDFAEMRRVILNYGGGRVELSPVPQAGRVYEDGVPSAYNIVDNSLEIVPESTTYTLELTYWKKVPALATSGTNDVLLSYPELYLYGTLLQGAYFMDDVQAVAKYQPQYERAMQQANAKRFRQTGTGLQVRAS